MSNRSNNPGTKRNSNGHSRAIEAVQTDGRHPVLATPMGGSARAARTQVVEETTYRLTDLFTTITGRIEILSDRIPSPCREELLQIRAVVAKCVELNRRLFVVAQECRSEMGI